MPLVSRTRATLRSAEFGFLGVVVYTRVHTPRRCGAPLSAGVLPLAGFDSRPLRTSCWMVGTEIPFVVLLNDENPPAGARGPEVNARGVGPPPANRVPEVRTGDQDTGTGAAREPRTATAIRSGSRTPSRANASSGRATRTPLC